MAPVRTSARHGSLDEVTATLHGKTVDIATFRTNGLRDKWIQVASQFAGIDSKGDRYAVADG